MNAMDVDYLNELLEQDVEIREKIKQPVSDLDKKVRVMVGILIKIHSTSTDTLLPSLPSFLLTNSGAGRDVVKLSPYGSVLRRLVEYLSSGSLITLSRASEVLGVKEEWADRFSIAVEDYLHGLISLVNELSRLAVNAVTLGDYEAPLRISVFVKDIFAGFTMVTLLKAFIAGFDMPSFRNQTKLNLKNDTLRRRFDSLKYDLKKIEEGRSHFVSLL
ncbi:Translin [Boletus reticuloceps]|uniref:Translin n=1 Tax=Boletus reticuloceps TaxID=495285 RepID=A0A8I2YQ68_9AGAM|nr:Translin [Boletus reticuloceps]